MAKISRALVRNQPSFQADAEGEVQIRPLPQIVGPNDPQWTWPVWVDNPHKYASYAIKLQKARGLITKVPRGAFMRFASSHQKEYGWEVLVRAAALATSVARHPFSPKFILEFLNKVPGKPTIVQRELF